MISHDRGGEWKTLYLTDEQCKEAAKASSSFDRDEFIIGRIKEEIEETLEK